MKKMMTGVAAITMMFATACSNEEIVKVDDSQEVFTVTATKGIDSRLEMKDGSLVWSDGDKLYVFGEGVDGFLTLISGAGTKTGTFVGRISGSAANLTNAVFGDDVKVEGGKVKISLENQSTEECDAPMDGRFSADKGSISLTPLCGIEKMKLNVTPTDGQMTIKGSGVAGMEFVNGEWRTLMGENLITIAGVEANESFYIPFFTQDEETPLTVTVNEASYTYISNIQEKQQRGTDLELNLANNELKDESGNTGITTVSSLDALNEALEDGAEQIALNADITSSAIITISSDVVLYGNGHTLTSKAGRAINVGQSGEGDFNVTIKDLIINASGERGINVIQGSHNVTLENVTATAANYTVNVAGSAPNSKVTINESGLTGLNVVNIAAIGTTMEINNTILTCNDKNESENYAAIAINPKDGSNSKVTVNGGVINVEGASVAGKHPGSSNIFINGTTGNNEIKVLVCYIDYGDNYNYSFATLEEAFKIVKDNENITLCGNITVTKPISHDGKIDIDRNGYTIIGVENITLTNGNIINSKDNN